MAAILNNWKNNRHAYIPVDSIMMNHTICGKYHYDSHLKLLPPLLINVPEKQKLLLEYPKIL